jgi:hypothetical protein
MGGGSVGQTKFAHGDSVAENRFAILQSRLPQTENSPLT